MKLLTKKLEKEIAGPGEQEGTKNPMVYAVFFHPMSPWYWFATEYDPERREFFGFVCGHENEFGYFSLDELKSVSVMGLGIERDKFFEPKKLSEVFKEYKGRTINDNFPEWVTEEE